MADEDEVAFNNAVKLIAETPTHYETPGIASRDEDMDDLIAMARNYLKTQHA